MTPIEKKYHEAGGENGPLGKAVTEELTVPDGRGSFQEYEGGIIYYHADYGACILTARIVEKWKSASVASTPVPGQSVSIRNFLGYPIRDSYNVGSNVEVCLFERGMIVCPPNTAGYVLYGAIYAKYSLAGGVASWMGFPTSDQLPCGGDNGQVAHFQLADIYAPAGKAACIVLGAIRDKYNSMGNCASVLGYPISDEYRVGTDGRGRASNFENGTMYWTERTGAHFVLGKVLEYYTAMIGNEEFENLGYPTCSTSASPNGKLTFNNFENGIVVTDGAGIKKITELKVYALEFCTDDDDDDLYVETEVKFVANGVVDEAGTLRKNFGEYEDRGQVSLSEQEGAIGSYHLRDGNTEVHVKMKAWEVDGGFNGDDDLIAEFTKVFTIDTLWDTSLPDKNGGTLLTQYTTDEGSFRADIKIELDQQLIDVNNSDRFRSTLFWNFGNNMTAQFTWKNLADTFADIEPNDEDEFHPIIDAFYKLMYRDMGKAGRCFGMCLEAIYALKGRSTSRQFIYNYSRDEARNHAIDIKHGYQLGMAQIHYYLMMLQARHLWNPKVAYEQSETYFKNANYSLLCVSKGADLKDNAHVVLPYKWTKREVIKDGVAKEEWIIYVADPNKPYGAYSDPEKSIIKIDPVANTFEYYFKGDGGEVLWTGKEYWPPGGRLFAMPYSTLSDNPISPGLSTLGMLLYYLNDITAAAAVIFLDSRVQATQLSSTGSKLSDETVLDSKEPTFIHIPIAAGRKKDGKLLSKVKTSNRLTPAGIKLPNFGKSSSILATLIPMRVSDIYPDQIKRMRTDLKGIAKKETPFLHMPLLKTAVNSNIFLKHIDLSNFAQKLPEDVVRPLQPFVKASQEAMRLQLTAPASTSYQNVFLVGNSKVIVEVKGSKQQHVDEIVIDSPGRSGQAFTYKADSAPGGRNIKMTLVNFDGTRHYVLDKINLAAGKQLTIQAVDNYKELVIHNDDQQLEFSLSVFAGRRSKLLRTAEITGISPNTAFRVGPEVDWNAPVSQSSVPIKLDIFKIETNSLVETRRI